MCATLISHGVESGCQVGGLYHPTLLSELNVKVNGPHEKPARAKLKRKSELQCDPSPVPPSSRTSSTRSCWVLSWTSWDYLRAIRALVIS